jgi:hypothetical protein
LDKYLQNYAEPGTSVVADMPVGKTWRHVVVIPVCNESADILRPLPPATGRSLVILVVNETEPAQRSVSLANRAFSDDVEARFDWKWRSGAPAGLTLFSDPETDRDILLVDRFTEGMRFTGKGGVGQARKTGADLAAFLFQRQRVKQPWIHCSDADVELPGRYFGVVDSFKQSESESVAALVYPFRHVSMEEHTDEKVLRMSRLYEYSLRYYVAGLNEAGSPYAFHTIGSAMTVNARHYASVRGFPRRQAGEDFYLLNKLAKVGAIRTLDEETQCGPIRIASRLSNRVPFGTGAAVGRMVKLENPAREFLFYHPAVFTWLKEWLDSLPEFWRKQSADLAGILNSTGCPELVRPLLDSGADAALEHSLRQSSGFQQFGRHMHTWFDAFRTLKLIHALRDLHFPSMGFHDLQKEDRLGPLLRREPALPKLHAELLAGHA